MTQAAPLWRTAGGMTVGTALSRVTGLLRVAAMTYALGVTGTKLADTYNLANTTPNIVYELLLGGILSSVFVPVLIDAREHRRGDPSALVSVSLIGLAAVSALAAIGAPLVMRIYTFRISDPLLRAQQLELATFLLRWFAPQIFFYGVSAIAQSLLNVRGRFSPPAFAPVLNNLVVAGTLLAFARVIGSTSLDLDTGARTLLGAGTTAGVVLQALVLLPFLRTERLRFRPDFGDPAVRRALRLSVFVIGYAAVNQLGLWVVLALANGVTGGVTAYQVAFMFFQLPHGLFAVSLSTALFPDLSRAAAAADWEAFRERFAVGLRGIFYLLAPAAVGYVILADPITRLVLARGVADARDAAAVASVLEAFALGLVFFSVFQLLTRCFYALGDTRTPTALNAVGVAVNMLVNVPLFAWLGVRGLGFGHAIGYVVGATILAVALGRKVPGGLVLRPLVRPLSRNAVVVGAMGLCVWGIANVVPGGDVGVVGAAVGAGAILYLAFSQVAGVEEREILLGPRRLIRPKS
ncbi:MAG: murein biosynthesis integral membrane protein MurJ [Actinomycetota bacterium]